LSNDTFSPGIGNLAGKALLALAKAEIRAMRWVWARYRRQVISSRIPHYEGADVTGLEGMYDVLVDFAGAPFHKTASFYNENLASWARDTLALQISTGIFRNSGLLRQSLSQSPVYVQLELIYGLAKEGCKSCTKLKAPRLCIHTTTLDRCSSCSTT
jgi:hypothetical protein